MKKKVRELIDQKEVEKHLPLHKHCWEVEKKMDLTEEHVGSVIHQTDKFSVSSYHKPIAMSIKSFYYGAK